LPGELIGPRNTGKIQLQITLAETKKICRMIQALGAFPSRANGPAALIQAGVSKQYGRKRRLSRKITAPLIESPGFSKRSSTTLA
jgi:hypothetical protein